MEAVVIFALVIFGLPIILSIIAFSKVNRLENDVAKLQWRLKQIERDGSVKASQASRDADFRRPAETKIAPAGASEDRPRASALNASSPQHKTQTPSPWRLEGEKRQKIAKAAKRQKDKSPKPQESKPQKPKAPKKSLEELIGAQWSVWVGGLAVLVGAVFLLRYSIEAGVFTPAMRVGMAAIMGVLLLGVGEWLHQNDLKLLGASKMKGLTQSLSQKAYIPTLLSAIGLFTLFGTVYAAYALYGFIGDIPAFVLLGLISVGGFALSFRHGGILAAVGLVGAMVVPLLVQSDTPSVYALYGYLALIAAVAFFVARKRGWEWLNLATLLGLLFWSMMSMKAGRALPTAFVWFAFLAVTFVINAYIAQKTEAPTTSSKSLPSKSLPSKSLSSKYLKRFAHTPKISALWTGVAALLVLFVLDITRNMESVYSLALVFAGLITVAAWVFRRNISYSLIGPGLAGFIAIGFGAESRPFLETLLIGVAFALSLLAFSVLRMDSQNNEIASSESPHAMSNLWAIAATAYPILFILAVLESSAIDTEKLLAFSLGGFAIVFAGLALKLRHRSGGLVTSARIYAAGSAIAYLLAVLIGLEGMALSLGLMAGIALYGAGAWFFKTSTPRVITPVFALLSAFHSLTGPLQAGEVSERFLFNGLWLYFALPCTLCAAAAWALSRRKADVWSESLKALGLTFAALFVVFQIRHIMNEGDILASRLSFDELSLQVLTGLSFTLGATRFAPHKWASGTSFWSGDLHTRILPTLAMAVSSVTLIVFALGVCFGKSPLLNEAELVRGNIGLNSLTLGYFLPALVLAFIAQELKSRRPVNYIRILGGLALLSFILFVTGMIRFIFTGNMISILEDFPAGFELYAISAAWLVLGIALLVAGLKRQALDLRLASAVLIILTVLKAFLIDMAELEGVLRAVSFVVLGLILIVIGRSYQKILFTQSEDEPAKG